jgi:predicted nucleotidyltransferase
MDETVRPALAELRSGLEQLYGERLRGLYLFGSRARGDAQPDSDVDVLVVLDRVESYHRECQRSSALLAPLTLRHDLAITPVFVAETAWLRHDTLFLRRVREEALAA